MKFEFLAGLLSFKLVLLLIYMIDNLSGDFGNTLKQHALTCLVIKNQGVHFLPCMEPLFEVNDEVSQNEV